MKRSDEMFKKCQDASIKFEYYLVGLNLALCAFLGKSSTMQLTEFKGSRYFELIALIVLSYTVYLGLRRLEHMNHVLSLNAKMLHISENKQALQMGGSNSYQKLIISSMTPEEVEDDIAAADKQLKLGSIDLKKTNNKVEEFYHKRNIWLGIGYFALIISKAIQLFI